MGARKAITFDQWKASSGYVDPETVHFRKRIASGFTPKPLFLPDHNSKIKLVAEKRMGAVDSMSPALRAIVHDYGDAVVKEFLKNGVREPHRIRHLIDFTRGFYADGRNCTAPNPQPGQRQNLK